MALAFYISGHGFGHASRDVEVLNALGDPGCPLLIRSSVNPDLLRRTLTVPHELLPGPCDTGILQASSITHDDPGTVSATLAFYADFEARVDAEVARLSSRHVRLVVSDIPPLGFAVAHRLGVPAIGLANFTWDWIYEEHPGFLPEGQWVIDLIREAYRTAQVALALPFSGGFEIFPHVRPIPMIARHARQDRQAARRHFDLPPDGPVVLLSFGGYGLPSLDLGAIDLDDRWTVVTTDRVSGALPTMGPRLRLVVEHEGLTDAFRYEDLVAASDVVLTKPGYGIMTECASTGTAMVYTSRGQFREYDRLVAAMPSFLRTRFLSQADLLAGRWRDALEGVLAQPVPPQQPALNGADVAAGVIRDALRAARPRDSVRGLGPGQDERGGHVADHESHGGLDAHPRGHGSPKGHR